MSIGKIAIVGCGMAASSLGPALKKSGVNLAFVFDRNLPKAQLLAALCGAKACSSISDISKAQTFILAVPDNAIAEVCALLPEDLLGKNVLHLSGSRPLSTLSGARERGANVGSWHPAQTLGHLTDFHSVSFGVTAEGVLRDDLFKLTKSLGARPVSINEEQKSLYHAATCLASNYVCTMLYMAENLLDKVGLSAEDSKNILDPLLSQAQINISKFGAQKALTGPISRGDTATIEQHLQALSKEMPHYLPAYAHVGIITVDMVQTFNPDIKRILQKSTDNEKKEENN